MLYSGKNNIDNIKPEISNPFFLTKKQQICIASHEPGSIMAAWMNALQTEVDVLLFPPSHNLNYTICLPAQQKPRYTTCMFYCMHQIHQNPNELTGDGRVFVGIICKCMHGIRGPQASLTSK